MAIFGTIAVSLALLGVYGVFAFNVAQRTREIGIRIALGAQRAQILKMVTGQALRVAILGRCRRLGCSSRTDALHGKLAFPGGHARSAHLLQAYAVLLVPQRRSLPGTCLQEEQPRSIPWKRCVTSERGT